MSRSYWSKFAKILGIVSTGFLVLSLAYLIGFYSGGLSGYYEGQADRSSAQYQHKTQSIVDGCFKFPTRAAISQCVSEAYAASHENQRAEKDLDAQRDMADWAWWVMVIGILQFFATIATLGFVKLTLDATLEAVKDTSEATEAMREANRIAEQAQRAWVDVKVTARHAILRNGKLEIGLRVKVKNVGNTVARFVSIQKDAEILSNGTTNKRAFKLFEKAGDRSVWAKVLQPNGRSRWDINVSVPEEFGQFGFLPVAMVHCTYETGAIKAQTSRCYYAYLSERQILPQGNGHSFRCKLQKGAVEIVT